LRKVIDNYSEPVFGGFICLHHQSEIMNRFWWNRPGGSR